MSLSAVSFQTRNSSYPVSVDTPPVSSIVQWITQSIVNPRDKRKKRLSFFPRSILHVNAFSSVNSASIPSVLFFSMSSLSFLAGGCSMLGSWQLNDGLSWRKALYYSFSHVTMMMTSYNDVIYPACFNPVRTCCNQKDFESRLNVCLAHGRMTSSNNCNVHTHTRCRQGKNTTLTLAFIHTLHFASSIWSMALTKTHPGKWRRCSPMAVSPFFQL